MLDIETMFTGPNAAIVSIGGVLFDPRRGIENAGEFYVELDWKNQKRKIDRGCYAEFWMKQPKEIRQALNGKTSLEEGLEDLAWFLPKNVIPWGNGPTFDIVILENAYRQCEMEIPWDFWNIRCMRTLKDLYEAERGGLEKSLFGHNNHNALDDAKYQANYACAMWRKIFNV